MEFVKKKCRICDNDIEVKKFYSWYFCDNCKKTVEYQDIVKNLYENKSQSKFINCHKKETKKIFCLGCSNEINVNFFSCSKYCDTCKKNNNEYKNKIKKQRDGEKEVFCKVCNEKTKIKKYSHSNICEKCFKQKNKKSVKTNYFTSPHRRLKAVINSYFPENNFLTEQWVSIDKKRFSLDELDIEKKIVILVDGDFWHANPKKCDSSQRIGRYTAKQIRERDEFVTKTLNDNGFVVLRFWQSVIDSNIDWCILSIKLMLQNFKKIQDIRRINSSIKSEQIVSSNFNLKEKIEKDNELKQIMYSYKEKFYPDLRQEFFYGD
jgi:very-short-patch-repair endonuclease